MPANTAPFPHDYWVGVGFARAGDAASLAVVTRTPPAGQAPARYLLSHNQSWPSAPFDAVARYTGSVVRALAPANVRLLVDAQLGGAVLDIFKRHRGESWMSAVLVTASVGTASGLTWSDAGDCASVPVVDLASTARVLLQQGRLALADQPGRDDVLRALRDFGARAGEIGRLAGWTWGGEPGDELLFAVTVPLRVAELRGPVVQYPGAVPGGRAQLYEPPHERNAERRNLFGAGDDLRRPGPLPGHGGRGAPGHWHFGGLGPGPGGRDD
jgi:hypothetical protein